MATESARPSTGANQPSSVVCVVVEPSSRHEDTETALRCLGRLVPPARLFVAPDIPDRTECEVLVVSAEDIAAGPLVAAAALARAMPGTGPLADERSDAMGGASSRTKES
jgi:hypothetical protein